TTMTVVVDDAVTPTFSNPGPVCSGTSFTLPTTSNNGISGTWSSAVDNTATTTYTFTPDNGGCASSTTMTVVVDDAVTPTFSNPDPVCSGTSFTLPTTSNNGISGTWSPEINNTITTTYTFTPSSGGCIETYEMTVVVENPSTVSISGNGAICVGESGPNLVFTASGGTAPYTFTYTVGNGDPQTVTSLG